MNVVAKILTEEMQRLKNQVRLRCERIKKAPQGFLRIANKKSGVEYYLKAKGERKGNGKYIKKKDIEIAHRIVQRDYDTQLLNVAEERMRAIERFLVVYNETELERIYEKLNCYRRRLLRDVILPNEEFMKQWEDMEYQGKPFGDNALELITEKGERVRSKSEKIIADKLFSLGISYRYEYPLLLDGNLTVYPDFTILKMPERKEVYLEHFGMLDNESYVEMMMSKLDMYARNGIYIGINLFFTYESGKRPLNTRLLDELIKKVFVNA